MNWMVLGVYGSLLLINCEVWVVYVVFLDDDCIVLVGVEFDGLEV